MGTAFADQFLKTTRFATLMKTSLFFVAASLAALLPTAHASSVTFGAIPTARTVVDASSAMVTSGLVWVGTFTNLGGVASLDSGLTLAQNVANVKTTGGWKQFTFDPATGLVDSPVTNTMSISGSGKVGGGVTDDNGTPSTSQKASFFDNKDLYLWLFNGDSSQMGIFRATDATIPWKFPINNNGLGDSVTLSSTTSAAPTVVAIGGFGSAPIGQFQLTNNFAAAPVPEPSTFAAGAMLMLAAMGVRRRRRG